jgi:hypothetical protein
MPTSTKSCGPQHSEKKQNSKKETGEQLQQAAIKLHISIQDSEVKLASQYWELGKLLEQLEKLTKHGEWEKRLATMKINKTRASKARAIYRTFQAEDERKELEKLTVEQAYSRRSRIVKSKDPKDTSNVKLFFNLNNRLVEVTEKVIADSEQLSPDVKEELIDQLTESQKILDSLLKTLKLKTDSSADTNRSPSAK